MNKAPLALNSLRKKYIIYNEQSTTLALNSLRKKYMMYKAPLALNSLRKTICIYKEKQCTTGVEQPAHREKQSIHTNNIDRRMDRWTKQIERQTGK